MTLLERITGFVFRALEASALAAATLTARLSTRHRMRAVEADTHELLLFPAGRLGGPVLGRIVPGETGSAKSRLLRRSHVTLDLDPRRFIFRTIDLPAKATEYIEAIVRNQIDRITPWPPEQVLFGWATPVSKGADGALAVTIAATGRDFVEPAMRRVQDLGAAVVEARVALPPDFAAANHAVGETVLVARMTAAAFAVAFWRRGLGIASAIVVVLVIGSSVYGEIASMQLAAARDELASRGTAARAQIAKALNDRDPAGAARRFVEQRKREVPFATLVLDAVSRILPDNSFVTSFELTGTRLRLIGVTTDAPALIPLLEASNLFSGASFFAPTTHAPDDPGDRFNIEATVRPEAFPR